MKIFKNILILFTSFFTLALFSALSVFFIEVKPLEKPIIVNLSAFSLITLPTLKSFETTSEKNPEDNLEDILIGLTLGYQKDVFAYYQGAAKDNNHYKESVRRIERKESFKLEPVVTTNTETQLKVSYLKVQSHENEINNKEIVKLYGFKAKISDIEISWSQEYERINLLALMDSIEEKSLLLAESQNIEQDSVSAGLASVQKDETPLDQTWEKEMVFIDYTAEESPVLDNQEERIVSLTDHMKKTDSIPSSVLNVINRETDKRQAVSTRATVDMASLNTTKVDVVPPVKEESVAWVPNGQQPANEYSRRTRTAVSVSKNVLSIYEANINSVNTQNELRNFEFSSEVMSTQRLSDDMAGKITITEKLNSSSSVLRGTILKHGFMRTKLDVVMEPGEFKLNIPLIPQATFSEFLDKENLVARGGFLLLEMPETANSVSIDRTYEAKIYLDRKFQVIEEDEDFEYVLFVGVSPGNVLLSYTNFRGQKAEKITHIVEDEVLYEGGGFVLPTKLKFNLTQKNMLGTQSSPYNLYAESLNFFNTEIQAQREAVASYSLLAPPKPHGARNYIEVREGRIPLYIGMWKQDTVELPSETFAQYILDSHQLRSLENACMIQVNLAKKITDAAVFGETEQGQMGVIQTYLDQDGQFNYDASEMATHLFLVGDTQGTISLKVNYQDGTTDIIQTFCSNNTYLIEQL